MKTFQTRLTAEIMNKIQAAFRAGLLVQEVQKTNLHCDICGKEEPANFHILSICKDKEQIKNDPMSGDVYTFGTTCFKRIVKPILFKEVK